MLYEDELTKDNLFAQYGRELYSISCESHILCESQLFLMAFTGGNIAYNNDDISMLKSEPPIYGLKLNEYSRIVAGFYEKQTGKFLLPSECFAFAQKRNNLCTNLCSNFDYLFTVRRDYRNNFAPISLTDLEKLYMAACKDFNLYTKLEMCSEYYCSVCECPLLYNIEKCWACEKGI